MSVCCRTHSHSLFVERYVLVDLQQHLSFLPYISIRYPFPVVLVIIIPTHLKCNVLFYSWHTSFIKPIHHLTLLLRLELAQQKDFIGYGRTTSKETNKQKKYKMTTLKSNNGVSALSLTPKQMRIRKLRSCRSLLEEQKE